MRNSSGGAPAVWPWQSKACSRTAQPPSPIPDSNKIRQRLILVCFFELYSDKLIIFVTDLVFDED
ncbi:MAG: hypothetical protein RIQ67_603 [Pseudomonadota bacterium]